MFSKKKKSPKNLTPAESSVKERTARKVAATISLVQNGFANIMGRWVNRLTVKGKKIFLLIFCLVFGSYSLYIMLTIFMSSGNELARAVTPDPISIPKHFDKAGDENTNVMPAVSENDFRKIQEFNRYMDSLKKSPSGKKVYDSIIVMRPGLLDSVKMLENIYLLQNK
jgi:hypothetical protein